MLSTTRSSTRNSLFPRGSPRIPWINKYFALVSNIQFFRLMRGKKRSSRNTVYFFTKMTKIKVYFSECSCIIFFSFDVFSTSYINVITALNPLRERCYFGVISLKIRFRLIQISNFQIYIQKYENFKNSISILSSSFLFD